ncbi:MAG TPA: DUF1175 family protein [Burkholderiaceae bacterium]|nr:DUF1175 family protein [Burkholderiaceae bacterium]
MSATASWRGGAARAGVNRDPASPGRARRRLVWAAALGAALLRAGRAAAHRPPARLDARLDAEQSRRFRDWMTLLVHAQLQHGPTPRWTHRDCAGLVRFVVAEALRSHDIDWRRANGLLGSRVPPDVDPDAAAPLRRGWWRIDGTRDTFVEALELVQSNARYVARDLAQAEPADLLFYDQGDDQHLMVWMGHYVAYHTGHVEAGDNGLRALRPGDLLAWSDTRWRPVADNPNFSGIYRLSFLA